jgi:GxxExxY protein
VDSPLEQGNARNPRKPFDDPRTAAIIGAAIEVHRTLGPGYLERVYHDALEIELAAVGVPFESEVGIPIRYKGIRLAAHYRVDLVCHGEVLVELKAQQSVGNVEAAQLINYLTACRLPIGLLLNFGESELRIKRYVGPEHFGRQPL